MSNLEEIIKSRRSIRKFKAEPVPLKVIEELLDIARYAPSACNIQGWRFIVITDEKIKEEIFNNGGSILIKQSPQAILFLYDNRTDNPEYRDDLQSAAAAIQNFLLLAQERGLGGCWINHLPKKKTLQKIFNLPIYLEPMALVIFGQPLNPATFSVPRKEKIEEMIGINKSNFKPLMRQPKNLYFIKFLKRLYYYFPKPLKKLLNNFLDKRFVKKFDN
jgi:nitroreductase